MTRGCTVGETLVTRYLYDGNGVLALPESRQRARVTCWQQSNSRLDWPASKGIRDAVEPRR